jgi:hypothetical protein
MELDTKKPYIGSMMGLNLMAVRHKTFQESLRTTVQTGGGVSDFRFSKQ